MEWNAYIAAMRDGVRSTDRSARSVLHDNGMEEKVATYELVFAGIVSTRRGSRPSQMADAGIVQEFHSAFRGMGDVWLRPPGCARMVSAEHFANFFMNNMPSFARGMADQYEGAHRRSEWLGIARPSPGRCEPFAAHDPRDHANGGCRLCRGWKFDHGIMVPLHFLTPRYDVPVVPVEYQLPGTAIDPLHRAWALGEAIRRAADRLPQRIAVVGAGGISHWPATPDSGKINESWDREFLRLGRPTTKPAMLSYTDEATYRDAGQGGFEIRAFIAVAAAAGAAGPCSTTGPSPSLRWAVSRVICEHVYLDFHTATLHPTARWGWAGSAARVPRPRAAAATAMNARISNPPCPASR